MCDVIEHTPKLKPKTIIHHSIQDDEERLFDYVAEIDGGCIIDEMTGIQLQLDQKHDAYFVVSKENLSDHLNSDDKKLIARELYVIEWVDDKMFEYKVSHTPDINISQENDQTCLQIKNLKFKDIEFFGEYKMDLNQK